MTLRKIERYDVTTSEPPDIDGLPGILLAVLGNALGGGGPTLTLYTKGGKTFPMYSIPESIATALGNLKEGKLSRDQFYVIKQLAKKGSDPYNSVQSVDVRIGSDLPECKLSEAIKSGAVLLVAKNKNPQLVYCSTKKRLEGDAESVVKFNDGE